MTLDEEIRRGHEAERVMNEPLLKSAFADVEAGIVSAMRQVKVADEKTQHELIVMLQLLGRVQSVIKEHMATGRMAQIQKETLAQKVKNRLRRVR